MARLPRLVVAGLPHHVIQRGNNRQAVFVDDLDRAQYRTWLRELAAAHEVQVHAYVLMPNHVHLLVTPARDESLAVLMQALGRRYVAWFNRRHGRTGGLWEGRYRSTVVDGDRYFLTCMRYIELNPVRAGLVDAPEHFRWSSFGHHSGAATDPVVSDHSLFWALGNTPFDRQLAYRQLFEQPMSPAEEATIRLATHRGRLLGTPSFQDEIARQTARPVVPRPRGRPRKSPANPNLSPFSSSNSLGSKK